MDEDTNSNAPVESGGQAIDGILIDDQGMAIPVPEETEQAEVVQEQAEPDAQTVEEPSEVMGGDEPAPEIEDKKLQKFAQSQGLELDSPNAIKAAQIAMKAQSEATKNYQKSAELERVANIAPEQISPDATPEQRDNIRVRNLELRYDIQQWKMQNPEKLSNEGAMVQLLSDPTKRALVQEGLLSLDDVYAMAKGSGTNDGSLKSQGGREALQTLAQKQQAAVPRGNAVTSGTSSNKITPQNVDSMVARMSPEEYRKRLPEINRALNG